ADQLIAKGLVRRSSSSLLVPDSGLLAAHAISHALVQNLATPQTYSPLRMVADLADLRRVQPGVVSTAASYLAPQLRVTCQALDRLCTSLSSCFFTGHGFDGSSEQT